MTGCLVTMYPEPGTRAQGPPRYVNAARSKATPCGEAPVDEHGHCPVHAEQRERLMVPSPPAAEWSAILGRLDAMGY